MVILLALALVLDPHREAVAYRVAGAAWGIEPEVLEALAWVESSGERNPRRYGTRERWGDPPLGRRWRICGLMQLHGGGRPMGTREPVRFPPCAVLVVSPELSVWYAAMHLSGWRRACGRRWLECWNKGYPGLRSDGRFQAAVMRRMGGER
jgi:hypothetical protein